jgi:hypothetical protein
MASRLAFFRRPLRLRGNSSISVPLGVVILFPCIVVILILILFVRHPSSPARILMPAGAPPAIRYVSTGLFFPFPFPSITPPNAQKAYRPDHSCANVYRHAGKSAKNTTRSL